jgi:hypothetical protein
MDSQLLNTEGKVSKVKIDLGIANKTQLFDKEKVGFLRNFASRRAEKSRKAKVPLTPRGGLKRFAKNSSLRRSF